MVELKNMGFIPKETQKARKVSRTMHYALGSVDATPESAKPLEYKRRISVQREEIHRKGETYLFWRSPNGKFAKRPEPGERGRRWKKNKNVLKPEPRKKKKKIKTSRT